jgi:transcription elongation factor Elf1
VYVPDVTVGVVDPSKLPQAAVQLRSRDYRRRSCPRCGRSCYRDSQGERVLHDLGNVHAGRPVDIQVHYSKHRCEACEIYFTVDMSDLAAPGSRYTKRVVAIAVRVVVEDGLPYREASWHLWRDHRVFVPFATIQNWVEAAGEKRSRAGRRSISRLGVGDLFGIHRRRRAL